jgi:hypothetical protein
VGCKAAYELLPATLKARLKKERKLLLEERQRAVVAEAVAAVAHVRRPSGARARRGQPWCRACGRTSSPAGPPERPRSLPVLHGPQLHTL